MDHILTKSNCLLTVLMPMDDEGQSQNSFGECQVVSLVKIGETILSCLKFTPLIVMFHILFVGNTS